jgi:hypothetical protein
MYWYRLQIKWDYKNKFSLFSGEAASLIYIYIYIYIYNAEWLDDSECGLIQGVILAACSKEQWHIKI